MSYRHINIVEQSGGTTLVLKKYSYSTTGAAVTLPRDLLVTLITPERAGAYLASLGIELGGLIPQAVTAMARKQASLPLTAACLAGLALDADQAFYDELERFGRDEFFRRCYREGWSVLVDGTGEEFDDSLYRIGEAHFLRLVCPSTSHIFYISVPVVTNMQVAKAWLWGMHPMDYYPDVEV
jgi:hypothetical protein